MSRRGWNLNANYTGDDPISTRSFSAGARRIVPAKRGDARLRLCCRTVAYRDRQHAAEYVRHDRWQAEEAILQLTGSA